MSRILYPVLILITLSVQAQDYRFHQYRVKDGLPTDVIKDAQQDSLGFLWLATDEGLTKFDGVRFTVYKNALRSQYAKRFLKTKSGSLYLIGDLDFIHIKNMVDTVIFTRVVNASRNPTDSTLWYPKWIYEDGNQNIWISEPQSISLINGKKFKRFSFDMADQTTQFIRSFTFFEDQNNDLYTISYPGRLFKYNSTDSVFQHIDIPLPRYVNHALVHNNVLWLAASDGLYRSELNGIGGFSIPQKVASITNPFYIQPLAVNKFFITSSEKDQFFFNPVDFKLTVCPYDISDVNASFLSSEEDLFLCSSNGLVLLQKSDFKQLTGIEDAIYFIESITEDPVNEVLYFSTIEKLYTIRIDESDKEIISLIDNRQGEYFQSLVFHKGKLWASNRFNIYLYENNKLVKSWNLEQYGRFIFHLFMDTDENLWISQDGNRHAMYLTKNHELKKVSLPIQPQAGINIIRKGKAGIFAGSAGESSYLYFKSNVDTAFVNISLPVTFKTQGDFSIVDIVIQDSIIWMASSEGLLKYDYRSIELVDLGEEHTRLAVRSLIGYGTNELLFSNPHGLFRYAIGTGEWWLYNDGNGLPSNTIQARGIYAGSNNQLWIGTSRGIAYSNQSIAEEKNSPTPWLSSVQVNSNRILFNDGITAQYGDYITLLLAPNTYPEIKTVEHYRFASDTVWTIIKGHQFSLSNLPAGKHTLFLRAKKTGGYAWSEVRKIDILITKPFWQTYWFYGLIVAAIALVSWTSFATARSLNRKRRAKLEELLHRIAEKNEEIQAQSEELTESNETIQLLNTDLEKRVEEKSKDLLKTNEELSKYNADLLQFSYSVSHNLRGPVARLLGLTNLMRSSSTQEELIRLRELVYNSTVDLDSVLRDLNTIIDMRSSITHVREKVLLEAEWSKCCSMLKDQIRPEFVIKKSFESAKHIYTVRALLHSILYNLLSNAIKYRSPDRNLEILATTKEDEENICITISDNGLGFDLESQREKVFKLYKRFHTHVGGRGLGLYLVKTQTELLNGSVEVESHLNEGTFFRLKFPKPESVERQVFFDNETAQVYYDANVNCTVISWKKEITKESYQLTFDTVVKTLKTFNSPGWIADLRNQGTVPVNEQIWFSSSVLPEARKQGLKRIASVGFKSPSKAIYYNRMIMRCEEMNIQFQDFDTLEEALEWMQESFMVP